MNFHDTYENIRFSISIFILKSLTSVLKRGWSVFNVYHYLLYDNIHRFHKIFSRKLKVHKVILLFLKNIELYINVCKLSVFHNKSNVRQINNGIQIFLWNRSTVFALISAIFCPWIFNKLLWIQFYQTAFT